MAAAFSVPRGGSPTENSTLAESMGEISSFLPAECSGFSQRKSRGPIVVTRARLRSSRKKGTSTTQPPEPAAFVAQRAARGPRDDKSLDAVNCPYPMWSSATTSCDATATRAPVRPGGCVS